MLTLQLAALDRLAALPGPADAESLFWGGLIALVGLAMFVPGLLDRFGRGRRVSGTFGTSCPTSPSGTPKPWGGAR